MRNRALRPNHEAFIRACASGLSNTDSYVAHIARPGSSRDAIYVSAAQLASRYALRIEDLRQKIRTAAEAKLILTKAEAAEFYSAVVRANPADLKGQEHLAQESVSWVDKDGNTRTRFKLPPKADCLSALAKLMGWNEPEKHDHLHAHALLDSPALRILSGQARLEQDGATDTADGGIGHPLAHWADVEELGKAEMIEA